MKKWTAWVGIFVFVLGAWWSIAFEAARTANRQAVAQNTQQARQQRRRARRNIRTENSAASLADKVSAERVSPPAPQADFPAVAVTDDGAIWVSYLEWNGGKTDRVLVRRKSPGGGWGDSIELRDGCFEHYISALAPRGDGVLAVWSGHNDDGFDLYYAEVSREGETEPGRQLTDAPFSDFNVACAADSAGNVTLAWQSFRNGQSDIYTRRLVGSKWGDEVRISPTGANDWEPSVALDSSGRAWIAWDSYLYNNYDVFVRPFDGREAGKVIQVTSESTAQFHTSVGVDAKDRVWIAWDDGGLNWGKDFSRASSVNGSRGLHFSRQIQMRVVDQGLVYDPAADLQKVMVGRLARFAELPHLMFDNEGALWMVFRHWTFAKPHEIYHFYATQLAANGWTTPVRLGNSSGRNTQHPGLALGPQGPVRLVYSSDGRARGVKPKDAKHALPYIAYQAALPEGGQAIRVELQPAELPESPPAGFRRTRHTHTVGETTYKLLLGDCHRHTDIRGHSRVDGSALDTYRYALDAAQLDFLGLGDHNQVTGGDWPDGLRDYQWWYEQKFVDLFTHRPYFIGIYSYEHSLGRPSGHRNILHLKRGAPMRVADRQEGGLDNPDNQPPNLWQWVDENVLTQPGQRVVIVPHTFAAGPLADWNWQNAGFDCLLEIYQGCRGSYEAWRLPDSELRGPTQTDEPGHFARDALRKGNVYGFVSFSDHGSTHNSWAGVWAKDATRESLFEAMLARRTFAASDEIIVRVSAESADGQTQYCVGEAIPARVNSAPKLHVDIEAPDILLRVDVVRDGQYVYTTTPNARTCRFTFVDRNADPGESYYYVRAFQRDPEAPGGDPEIAWASPFFVTYRQ